MSDEEETRQKTADDILFEFEKVFDNVEFDRLVNKYGSQYRPQLVKLGQEEIKDITKYNTLKEFHDDVRELRAFYETVFSLGADPEDFEHLFSSIELKCLKLKMEKEEPIKNQAVIVNVVERVLTSSGLPSWVYEFSKEEEEEGSPEYPVLSQNDIDSLLNATGRVSEEEDLLKYRTPLESELGIENNYVRLEYEFLYLLALAKKGTFYKDLFFKKTLGLAQFLAAWEKLNEVLR